MSIKEKLEQAQSSKVVFEITGEELTEFVKQLTTEQVGHKSAPMVITNVATPRVSPGMSKINKELQETIQNLNARVETLENLLYDGKQVLNSEEAAIFLGMARSSLYKMTHRHEIPFYRPNGKVIYFEKEELIKWMRSCRESSEKEIDEAAKIKMRELALIAMRRKK